MGSARPESRSQGTVRLAKTHISRLLRQNRVAADIYQKGDWVQVVADCDQFVRVCEILRTQGFYMHHHICADGRRSMLVGISWCD